MDLEVIHNYCINQNILLDETTFLSWYVIVKPILDHEEFLKRQYFKHHENQSVYEHSLLVSACAYELAFKYNANLENCAIAGMLHDFYTAAWQYSIELEQLDEKYREYFLPNYIKPALFKMHGFTHPESAAENTQEYFPQYINDHIKNAILTHMFPLSIATPNKLPKYKEAWIIQLADKIISCKDLPTLENSLKYVGLTRKKMN